MAEEKPRAIIRTQQVHDLLCRSCRGKHKPHHAPRSSHGLLPWARACPHPDRAPCARRAAGHPFCGQKTSCIPLRRGLPCSLTMCLPEHILLLIPGIDRRFFASPGFSRRRHRGQKPGETRFSGDWQEGMSSRQGSLPARTPGKMCGINHVSQRENDR